MGAVVWGGFAPTSYKYLYGVVARRGPHTSTCMRCRGKTPSSLADTSGKRPPHLYQIIAGAIIIEPMTKPRALYLAAALLFVLVTASAGRSTPPTAPIR